MKVINMKFIQKCLIEIRYLSFNRYETYVQSLERDSMSKCIWPEKEIIIVVLNPVIDKSGDCDWCQSDILLDLKPLHKMFNKFLYIVLDITKIDAPKVMCNIFGLT